MSSTSRWNTLKKVGAILDQRVNRLPSILQLATWHPCDRREGHDGLVLVAHHRPRNLGRGRRVGEGHGPRRPLAPQVLGRRGIKSFSQRFADSRHVPGQAERVSDEISEVNI